MFMNRPSKTNSILIAVFVISTIIFAYVLFLGFFPEARGTISMTIVISFIVFTWRAIVNNERVDKEPKPRKFYGNPLDRIKNPLNILAIGYQRLLLSLSFVVPIILALTVYYKKKYSTMEDFFYYLTIFFIIFWILTIVSIWVYKGFEKDRKNN